jgi:SAM-dependent methyltransferase
VTRAWRIECVRFEAADAAELPFDAAAFSAVLCGFGLSHFPDLSAALGEIRRVLASGGLFVECSWASEGSSPAFSAALRLLEEVSGGELHAFAGILDEGTWGDVDRGGSALREAGFTNVAALTESFAGAYRDASDALAWALAWPDYGQTFAKLDAPTQADYQERALEAIDQADDLCWEFAINYYLARP